MKDRSYAEMEKDSGYPFAWLDRMMEISLNPSHSPVEQLNVSELANVEQQISNELSHVYADLKARTFYLYTPEEIKAVLKQYLNALKMLKRQALQNQALYPSDVPIQVTGENVIILLEEWQRRVETRYSEYLPQERTLPGKINNGLDTPDFKILCPLSVDQLGIILKAADDTKLLISRSLSLIFRSIVPFLSTDKIKNISWNSMRKSTYQPEQPDKEMAIAALEKLIRKIRDY